MSSAAESEVVGVFCNAQMAIPICVILKVINHPQSPTLIKTDNSTTNRFIHDNIHHKKYKPWDMKYYWLRCKETQQLFKFFWEKCNNNEPDYPTKHHATIYHRDIRSRYIQDKNPLYIYQQKLQRICTQLENICNQYISP